jgi:hypothetical protein
MAISLGLIVGLTNPIAAIAAVGSVALLGGVIASQLQKVGDAVIPSIGGPIISTREGGLFQGTANDDVLMGPGLARGRNAQGTVTLSDQQIKQIADAVRDGASRATITMDGGKVSSRLQTPMIVNTLPGV